MIKQTGSSTPTGIRSRGFSAVGAIIIVMVAAIVGVGGWHVWHKNSGNDTAEQATNTETAEKTPVATSQQNPPANPFEESKYLVVEEWGVRVALPEGLSGVVTYKMGEVFSDPDGNQIQGAVIMLATSVLPGNECGTFSTSVGEASETGAQYIRSESAKPFNAERYRWTFKENVLKTNGYNYHLNYVTPGCIGAAVDKVEALQAALINLRQLE